MPPNRKGSADIAEGIASLNVAAFVTTSKYPTLNENAATDESLAPAKKSTTESESYWDWPADVQPKVQFQQDLFSVDHIEANLKKAGEALAQRASVKQQDDDVKVETDASESYWYMPSERLVDVDVLEADHVQENLLKAGQEAWVHPFETTNVEHEENSYWDWPAFSEKTEEERLQALFQVEHIEKNLVELSKNCQPVAAAPNPEHDSYWVY